MEQLVGAENVVGAALTIFQRVTVIGREAKYALPTHRRGRPKATSTVGKPHRLPPE